MEPRIVVGIVLWLGMFCSHVRSSSSLTARRKRYEVSRDEINLTEGSSNSNEERFSQQLDHFNPTDERQWSQRYWVNAKHYETGAPVFLYIGGEMEETGLSEDLREPWEQNAVKNNALMFKLEHRFYGGSIPTKDDGTMEYLIYLSSEQALADLANFIASMNHQYQLRKGTKWIAFGCSYPGSLAAWLRYKYPHLVYGAVASSAALVAKVNCPEYHKSLGDALTIFYGKLTGNQTMGNKCFEAFKLANREMDVLLNTSEGLNVTIQNLGLNHLLSFDSNDSIEELSLLRTVIFTRLLFYVGMNVQLNKYDESSGKWNIELICDSLVNESSGELIVRYTELLKTLQSQSDPKLLQDAKKWSFQTCTELPNFQTIKDVNVSPEIPLEIFFLHCQALFGDIFTEEFVRRRVERTKRVYGGLDIEATRVIYVHGSLDPWLSLGINSTRNPLSPVIMIEGASHCTDTRPNAVYDSASLRAARQNISDIISEWLRNSSS